MSLLYSRFCKDLLLPLGDVFSGQRVMEAYRFYSEAQWWDNSRLREYQNDRLKETVQIAYNEVPFYRQLYDDNGLNIKRINSVTDLPSLPIVTKSMLRAAYPHDCSRKSAYRCQEYFTSGSSGQPFAVQIDNFTLSHARALMLLRANFSGWEIGKPFLQTGMSLKRGLIKKGKDLALRTQYVSAFDLSNPILDKYLGLIEKKKLKYLMGYPGSLYYLAQRAAETGFNMKMDGIVSWGDNLYGHYRKAIEKHFCCRITDTYGCGEGIQVAAQCGAEGAPYHIFMPHVAVEVVDDDGQPVPKGKTGNILLTRLDPGVMPLIRYKIGDIGRQHDSDTCACGRGLEMLGQIMGRDTDVIETPNGNRLIVHFFTGIFEYYQSIETFRVTQDATGSLNIEIVPGKNFKIEDWEGAKQEILEKGDQDLEIKLQIVPEIPPNSSNKRRFVVSNRSEKQNAL
jgi:phenylacetate-CoA ligase